MLAVEGVQFMHTNLRQKPELAEVAEVAMVVIGIMILLIHKMVYQTPGEGVGADSLAFLLREEKVEQAVQAL
jgi:hypothetical protein